MEIITNFWVLFFFFETMHVNEVQKLNNTLCITFDHARSTTLIVQWPRVSRGSLALCLIPRETSSQDCLEALFYYIMTNLEWAGFLGLGPPQGSGVILLEDLCPSSSFCPSCVAFSLLMWYLCSITHSLLHLQIKRPFQKTHWPSSHPSCDDSQISVSSSGPSPECLLENTIQISTLPLLLFFKEDIFLSEWFQLPTMAS